MKKFFSIFLLLAIFCSLVGCSNEDPSAIDLIDFENGQLNIDTQKIENYIRENGYEDYHFSYNVNRSIYQCRVSLSADESAKITIDGDGYEVFLSETRGFLMDGTNVMNSALSENGLSGISCGMFLVSNNGTVYCAALNGSINYVAHIKNEIVTVDEVEEVVKTAVSPFLENASVFINNVGKTVVISHTPSIGIFTQEVQANIIKARNATVDCLKNLNLRGYKISIQGERDEFGAEIEDDFEYNPTIDVSVPEELEENLIATSKLGGMFFEIVSSEESCQTDAEEASNRIKQENEDALFICYITDNNGVLLGCVRDDSSFERYSFHEAKRESYDTPVDFLCFKYLNDFEVNNRQSLLGLLNVDKYYYQHTIELKHAVDVVAVATAAERMLDDLVKIVGPKSGLWIEITHPDIESVSVIRNMTAD